MENESKLRLLYINKILHEQTDEGHMLSTVQIIDILAKKYGIVAHRVTVGNDIEVLRSFGVDICKMESTQNKYFVAQRAFEFPEVKILLDAVNSSKLITDKKARVLSKKLTALVSDYQAGDIKRNISTEHSFKAKNEKIYYIVDTINEAINLKRKITFKYFSYDENKNKVPRHDDEIYVFSPYALVWNDDYYYAVGFSHKYGNIGCFRVDRIASVPEITSLPAEPIPKDFEVSDYIKTTFRMYGGERVGVTLLCENRMMDAIVDKFGEGVMTVLDGEDHFKVFADVCPNSVFFRWVFGYGGGIKILYPESVKEKYAEMVKKAYEML